MGFVKKIPIVGPLLFGPDIPKAPEPPPPPPPPPPVEAQPVTAMPDPEDEAAKKRKRREAAAMAQSGRMSTILSDGSGTDKLGG